MSLEISKKAHDPNKDQLRHDDTHKPIDFYSPLNDNDYTLP